MTVFNNFHNEQILKLDVKQQQPNSIPRIVQYDSALLKIEMYDNGVLYDVSRATDFVVSIKRPDGSEVSGLAEYDGEFVNYKLTKQDMEQTGEHEARLQVYESRHRLSTLSFRYDVYEDFESVGDPDEQTLLSQLFTQVNDILAEAQRQGNYAENRGDFANDAGDYAMDAGDSQKMRWLMYVNTIEERDQQYPNPQNGDVLYVVNVDGMDGGAVFRYNSIQQPPQWVEIAGYDVSIIQDIYNVLSTKESKAEVKRITDEINDNLEALTIGGTNLASIRPEDRNKYNMSIQTTTENVYKGFGIEVISTGTVGSTSYLSLGRNAEFKNNMKYVATAFVYDPNNHLSSATLLNTGSPFEDVESNIYELGGNLKKIVVKGTASGNVNGNFLIYFKANSTVNATVSAWKIEEGTRPTDWSPNFNDIVYAYTERIDDLEDSVNDTITTHNARLEVLEDSIEMTVEKNIYDQAMNELESWKSQRIQEANQIIQTVSHKVGENEVISKFNQSPEAIKLDAERIQLGGDVTVTQGLIQVKKIRGSASNSLELGSSSMIMTNNSGQLSIGTAGIVYLDSNGSVRYRVDEDLVTSSAFGTSNFNAYIAPKDDGEARVIRHSDVGGNGLIGSYRYLPMRASGFLGNFLNVNPAETTFGGHLYLRPLSGQEVRITLSERTTNYQNLRADWLYGNRLMVNTLEGENSHFYLGTTNQGELRVVHMDSYEFYRAVRARDFFTDTSLRENKKDIEVFDKNTLDVFRNAEVYTYRRNNDEEDARPQLGMMLDEMPTETYSDEHDSFGMYRLTSYVAKGVKDVVAVTDEHDDRLASLELENQELQHKLEVLESKLDALLS